MEPVSPSPALFLLLACVSLALAILVHAKARPGPMRNYFSLFAVSVALWLASGFLLYSGLAPQRGVLWARIAFAAGALLILSLYHVLMLFPDFQTVPFGRAITCVGGVLVVLSLLTPLLARDVTTSGVRSIKVDYGVLFLPFTAYAVAVLIVGMFVLVRRFRGAVGLRRLQIQYILLGTVIPVAGVFLMNLILPLMFRVTALAPYGRLFALVFLPLTAHAIIRHRLMDIRLFVQKAVVYISAVVFGGAFFGGLLWLVELLNPSGRQGSILESLLLAIGIVMVFAPVKNKIELALNRYLYRERHDYPKVLRESSQRLGTILDAPSMANYLAELVSAMFKAELVEVYLRDQAREAFVPLVSRVDGGVQREKTVVLLTDALPSFLDRDRRSLIGDEVPNTRSDRSIAEAATELRKLGGELAIGFWQLGGLRGFLILGKKRSGDPYFSEDIDFLITLGSQAAIAVENIQLHRQMGEERVRAERLGVIGTLASGLAHEIKNPLVAIRTFAELLPERFQDEDFRNDFSKIVTQEIGRIDGLVTRLRELATRPTTQQLVPLDLRSAIGETLTLLRGQLEKQRVRVSTEFGDDLRLVLGDFNLLKQLFLNLFMNAIDAMEVDGELSIRLRMAETSGADSLVVDVTDSGSGIPDEVIPRVFEPFFTRKANGSGLGLTICRSIADTHRARIRARNNVDRRGATFTVEFPVDPASRGAFESRERLQTEHAALTHYV